ncbi:hypothetical protein PFAG_04098 [Plasmodium falciparum Santa Lucia]|uniref:Uncharacterized protein n=3 Tax=Plasmodium falciparum TaxID=5833 RepID=W7F8C7_PLAF8|nr:hypothetical protein PFNF135_04255 [Plasmodium falciparum NF135/5.C10]EUR67481.1 hypothetical protein PFBG_04161 [Plasmodium falciparum 7G8]EUT81917.1 hypothetical protein PFAG_04098 [Plasmodium falciparum Santa Lucia]
MQFISKRMKRKKNANNLKNIFFPSFPFWKNFKIYNILRRNKFILKRTFSYIYIFENLYK